MRSWQALHDLLQRDGLSGRLHLHSKGPSHAPRPGRTLCWVQILPRHRAMLSQVLAKQGQGICQTTPSPMRKDATSSSRTSLLHCSIRSPRKEVVGQGGSDHAVVSYKGPGMVYMTRYGFLHLLGAIKGSLLRLDILCALFSPPRKSWPSSGAAGGVPSHIEVAGFATMGVLVTIGNHAARSSTCWSRVE